ncbi:nucleotide pyrophosphohydrolase [Erysipelothrix sp. P66]|uniref:nucleotide pyrophosphohydrolase n=1 Tax=Erysipelothrix sp. P66 TaxID=3141531 RepID=UPI00315D3BD5
MNKSMVAINKFRDERNWRQFHNEKDLAISISLEASELLELFQWKTADEGKEFVNEIKEELADVLIYAYMMVDNMNLDIDEIISEKLTKNAKKYPISKSFGNKKKYDELDNEK